VIIRKYGIELHRLTHEDIEMIRQARNRDDIRSKMLDQRLISPEQQEQWFKSIDNRFNYYFIIHYQGKKIGMIHGKNVDYQAHETEGGTMIWETDLLLTSIPARASILMMEASFSLILMDRVFAHTRPDNPKAMQYNAMLGYVPVEGQDNLLVLTKSAFKNRIAQLRKLAANGKHMPPLSMDDIEIPDAQKNIHLYEKLPTEVLSIFRPKLTCL
jgi:RimJ/RimL family protein N-acetyltransferase